MNTFTLSPHGETQYRLQHADQSGNGTHIICTAEELAQLRELLAPTAWQDKPSGAGKYVRMPLPDLPYILQVKDVFEHYGEFFASNPDDDCSDMPVFALGGLWLKLPDVPAEGKPRSDNYAAAREHSRRQ